MKGLQVAFTWTDVTSSRGNPKQRKHYKSVLIHNFLLVIMYHCDHEEIMQSDVLKQKLIHII